MHFLEGIVGGSTVRDAEKEETRVVAEGEHKLDKVVKVFDLVLLGGGESFAAVDVGLAGV